MFHTNFLWESKRGRHLLEGDVIQRKLKINHCNSLQFIIIHTFLSSGELYYTEVAVWRRKSTYRNSVLYLSIAWNPSCHAAVLHSFGVHDHANLHKIYMTCNKMYDLHKNWFSPISNGTKKLSKNATTRCLIGFNVLQPKSKKCSIKFNKNTLNYHWHSLLRYTSTPWI